MAQLARVNPMIGAVMRTPGATKALLEQWVRLYHVSDKQAFLGREATAAMQEAAQALLQPPGGPAGGLAPARAPMPGVAEVP